MITGLLLVTSIALEGVAPEAPFQDLTFDQALTVAAREGKVVMIDFFTTWCAPCKQLDKVTWKDGEVRKWLAEKTVALKIDAEKEVELAKRFAVAAYPSIVFVKPDGKVLDQLVGYKAPAEFLKDATDALAGKDSIARAKEKLVGHEKDPSSRQDYAHALAQAGRFEEALAEYLWCFDHGNDDRENGYFGVRLSFLLGDIQQLGRAYPPALRALEDRRDRAEAKLLTGKGVWEDAMDFMSLSTQLDTKARILSLYDRLRKESLLNDDLARVLAPEVTELLVEAKRYEEVLEVAGDVWKRVKTELAPSRVRPGITDQADDAAQAAMEAAAMAAKTRTVTKCSAWYEALLGTGKKEDAAAVADRLIDYVPSGATYATLIGRAVHAGANDVAQALADRGLSSLADKEKKVIERAAKKIPAPK